MRALLLFVDGVGLGEDDATTNPFLNTSIPSITSLLDGARVLRATAPLHAARASLVGVDATLGVAGTPQSGTGQASLLTGQDAVALHGRHFGPWVPSRLRDLVREQNILSKALRAGRTAAFANAYPEEVLQNTRRASSFLRAGPPLAALGAGLLTRHTPELMAGNAVASEITNEGWRERLGRIDLPVIDAHQAGRNLATIVAAHDVTLFAHYATDYAGHRRDMAAAVAAIEHLDAFVGGLVEAITDDTLIVMVGDHGNIEDVSTGHTRNPVIGLAIGAGHETIARRMHSLTDVTPALLEALEAGASQG